MAQIIGEIIQTSTREMTGQVWRDQPIPAFGSMVMAKLGSSQKDAYAVGVIHNVQTIGADINRLPVAFEIPEDDIPQKHPQLQNLLKSYFHAYWVGIYKEAKEKGKSVFRFQPGLPPSPPSLHAGIRESIDDEIRMFFEETSVFRLVFDASKGSEELLLQITLRAAEAYGNRRDEIVRLGKGLSVLYRDDYDTLRRMMMRIEQGS